MRTPGLSQNSSACEAGSSVQQGLPPLSAFWSNPMRTIPTAHFPCHLSSSFSSRAVPPHLLSQNRARAMPSRVQPSGPDPASPAGATRAKGREKRRRPRRGQPEKKKKEEKNGTRRRSLCFLRLLIELAAMAPHSCHQSPSSARSSGSPSS